MDKTWAITLAICRCAIIANSSAAFHQVERLKEELLTQGETLKVEQLNSLLYPNKAESIGQLVKS